MNNELVTLVTVLGFIQDSDGFKTEEKTAEVEVFAGIKSVGRTEFYEAMRNGIQASAIFVMDSYDFKLSEHTISVGNVAKKVRASRIIHDGTIYRIARTYRKESGMLEVTCEEVE